jgi:hypothetical protein
MSTGASIALIFLIIESMIFVLIGLAIVGGMVYGMHKLRGVLKRLFPQLQGYSYTAYTTVHGLMDKVITPFLWAQGTNANVRAAANAAKRRVRR